MYIPPRLNIIFSFRLCGSFKTNSYYIRFNLIIKSESFIIINYQMLNPFKYAGINTKNKIAVSMYNV